MNGIIQIRVEEELKKQASIVFETYGLDLSTAIRMFLKEAVMRKSLPIEFDPIKHKEEFSKALNSIREKSKKQGWDKLTETEINDIIDEVRENKKKENKAK